MIHTRKEEGALKSKIGHFLQILILVFLSLLSVLFLKYSPATVYASEYFEGGKDNDNGGGGSWGNTTYSGNQVGYRVYLFNVTTNSIYKGTPVIDFTESRPSGNKAYRETRLGGGTASETQELPIVNGKKMPTPFNMSQSHQAQLKAWAMSKAPNGTTLADSFIKTYFGVSASTLPADTYLIFEDLIWKQVPNTTNGSGSNTGLVFYGTYYNLSEQFYPNRYLAPQVSGGYAYYKNDSYWRVWHQYLPRSLYIEDANKAAKLGMVTPQHLNDKAEMFGQLGNQSLGLNAYHVGGGDDSITHTWDKKNCPKTPGKAPDDTSLYPAHDSDDPNYNCHIVKLYYDLKDDGKTPDETKPRVKDKNCFYRDLTCTKIEVEDEEEVGYRVMDWSTSYSSGNEWENVTHWSEVPTPIQKATKKTLLSIHTHTNASLSSRALFFCLFLEVCRTAYFSIEHLAVCAVYPFPQHHGFPSSCQN